MPTLVLDKSFPTFNQKKKKSVKERSRRTFNQIISPIERTVDYKASEYFFDYLSEITRGQSLSQEQIARSQTKVFDEKLESLSKTYKIIKADEVKNFLAKNRFLIALLEEIPNKISQYFGGNQNIALKISHEPEFPNSSELWIEVLTELSAKESLPILDKFDEEWWLENMERAHCKLNITLKFV